MPNRPTTSASSPTSNEQWVLLWSQSQNCFHVETLESMLKTNATAFLENRRMDYVPLFLGSEEAVHSAAEASRHHLVEREL